MDFHQIELFQHERGGASAVEHVAIAAAGTDARAGPGSPGEEASVPHRQGWGAAIGARLTIHAGGVKQFPQTEISP